ncbi:MAG: hypothetical protein LC637_00185 [Xanthomonadaceae bacterium]|nr:hypothetical protein [Xanthomonadaceae bacterium]
MKRDAIVIGLCASLAIAWLVHRLDSGATQSSGLSSTALLSAAPENFKRVTGPEGLQFPSDHAMHPGFRNEWWYFTGNLESPVSENDTSKQRRFGFQFTLFRFALDSQSAPSSDFAADALWMAHVALSDLDNQRFYSRERLARGALGLAGATTRQWWLKDWTVVRVGDAWQLETDAGEFALSLILIPEKPIIAQGNQGYSRKGREPGNASMYYSISRLSAEGRLRLDGQTIDLAGLAWLDREWGSSQLDPGLAGWDWFALQLDDGRDLMLYRLRDLEGRASAYSAGMLVGVDGQRNVLDASDFQLLPVRTWRDADGVEWPVAWRIEVAGFDLSLEVEASFDAQRWRGLVDYWEGAVLVRNPGTQATIGRGYLELSGYSNRNQTTVGRN